MKRNPIATGDIKEARDSDSAYATMARELGWSEDDIASVAEALRDKFGITSPEELRQAMANMCRNPPGPGPGPFALKDAAQYLGELGPAELGPDKDSESSEYTDHDVTKRGNRTEAYQRRIEVALANLEKSGAHGASGRVVSAWLHERTMRAMASVRDGAVKMQSLGDYLRRHDGRASGSEAEPDCG